MSRKVIDQELLDLKSVFHFSDNDVRRVQSAIMIHKASMAKNLGNEVFKMIVLDAKGQPIGIVHSECETSVFSVIGKV